MNFDWTKFGGDNFDWSSFEGKNGMGNGIGNIGGGINGQNNGKGNVGGTNGNGNGNGNTAGNVDLTETPNVATDAGPGDGPATFDASPDWSQANWDMPSLDLGSYFDGTNPPNGQGNFGSTGGNGNGLGNGPATFDASPDWSQANWDMPSLDLGFNFDHSM